MDDHARLARARAGEDEARPAQVMDGLELRGVEGRRAATGRCSVQLAAETVDDGRERLPALGDLGDPAEVARRAVDELRRGADGGADARVELRADMLATCALSMFTSWANLPGSRSM